MMNGIDISGNQAGINLSTVPADFIIVKATQGTTFVNPEYKRQMAQAEQLGRYLGVYHYAGKGKMENEAEHFLKTVDPYIGRAILCLDWEKDQNSNFNNPSYAVKWLDYIKAKTGITPFIYMSKSVCREHAKVWNPSYPLWCAQYANYQLLFDYKAKPWTDDKGYGPWKDCKIHQYSSRGRLGGYNKPLDLDLAYMDGSEWNSWAQGQIIPDQPQQEPKKPTLKKGSKGDYVKAWQTYLNANGYQCGAVDGIFGKKTEQAVKAYQKSRGLKADGIIGPLTWATIL